LKKAIEFKAVFLKNRFFFPFCGACRRFFPEAFFPQEKRLFWWNHNVFL